MQPMTYLLFNLVLRMPSSKGATRMGRLFITSFSFIGVLCLIEKRSRRHGRSVRYDGLRVFSVSLINLMIQQPYVGSL